MLAASAPFVVVAVAAHLVVIPRRGAVGAAAVTASLALLAAAEMVWLVHRVWGVQLPIATAVRSAVVATGAYVLAAAWRVTGPMIVLQLIGVMAAIVLAYRLTGEFTPGELAGLRFTARRVVLASPAEGRT